MKVTFVIDIPELERLLRESRDSKDLTQDDVASQIGMTASAVSQIENGRYTTVPYETLKLLAWAIELPLGDRIKAAFHEQIQAGLD